MSWRKWWPGAIVLVAAAAVSTVGNATLSAPPRFDGAGYAVLARALLAGEGYSAIDHPDKPRHVHFPPGYPLTLAAVWKVCGVSARSAHLSSVIFTIGGCLAAWAWFRGILPAPAAWMLALALAVNWQWARTGSLILSEPLFLLLSQLVMIAALSAGSDSWRATDLGVSGILLAASLLTRQVAIGLFFAVLIDLAYRRRWQAALGILVVTSILVGPWLGWTMSGGGAGTQASLLTRPDAPFPRRIFEQAIFYAQRIPDQICGPFVEVGSGSSRFGMVANVWAILVTGLFCFGTWRLLLQPEKRLVALVGCCTLAILVVWPFTEAGRFLIPLIPMILLALVEGLAALFDAIRRWGWPETSPAQSATIAAGLLLAASAPYSVYSLMTGRARALESTHRDFDAACEWIVAHADRRGPIISRHPGEVYWQTGRQSIEPTGAVGDLIRRYGVAYLLRDRDRYARSTANALDDFVSANPGGIREVWRAENGSSVISICEIVPGQSAFARIPGADGPAKRSVP